MASNWETCWLPSEKTDSGAAVRTEGFDASAVIGSAVRELEAYGTFRAGEELTIRRDASLPAESYR